MLYEMSYFIVRILERNFNSRLIIEIRVGWTEFCFFLFFYRGWDFLKEGILVLVDIF